MNIDDIINPFDKLTNKTFDENDVNTALRKLLPDDKSDINYTLKAELMAFDFAEDYQDQKTGWGTYFGPMVVWNSKDGTATESPSIKHVTSEMIDYWEKRTNEVVNPILKARYSGLVWDFKNKITGNNPNHEICRIYITSLITIANEDFQKHEVDTIKKLKRALSLSISYNDNELINKVKDAILSFEARYSIDDKPGLWGYSFDLLIDNKKINLSEEKEKKIILDLEEKLKRLTTSDTETQKIDPWAAEAAAERLAVYYRKKQKNQDVKRVILEIGKAYDRIIDDASALQASGWLEHLHNLYINFNLKEESETILQRIRDLGPKVDSELKPISETIDLPKEEMEKYISSITSGSPIEIINNIAILYIPNKEKVKEQIFDLSKNAPLMYLFNQKIQDEKGRVIATIGSLQNDLEGHVVRQVSSNLSFSAIFLRSVLTEAINNKGLDKINILKFIEKTPVISNERFDIIERALDAYFENDFVVFIHLVIPQIEEAIRNIVEFAGGNVLKPSKSGGFHLRTFDEILRDDVIKESLGEDFADYFRILYTDQRGWNLRNSVCHGMAMPNMFNQQTADRVLHSLICLGLIHKEEK